MLRRRSGLTRRRFGWGICCLPPGRWGWIRRRGRLVAGGITEQTTRVLENLKAVLAKAGLDMVHVVKTTVFLKQMSDFAAMNAVYAKYLAPAGGGCSGAVDGAGGGVAEGCVGGD